MTELRMHSLFEDGEDLAGGYFVAGGDADFATRAGRGDLSSFCIFMASMTTMP